MSADPFHYHAPTEVTAPLYAAIREAEKACQREIADIAVGSPQMRAAHHYLRVGYVEINEATKAFYDAIEVHVPPGADKSAALRCVRIARMAANDALSLYGADRDRMRQCRDNLRAARWQACAAVALHYAEKSE